MQALKNPKNMIRFKAHFWAIELKCSKKNTNILKIDFSHSPKTAQKYIKSPKISQNIFLGLFGLLK